MRMYFIFRTYEIMKKPYMQIIGSSKRDHVLMILFQLCGAKAGLFESNLFWVGKYDSPNLPIKSKTNQILKQLNAILKQHI